MPRALLYPRYMMRWWWEYIPTVPWAPNQQPTDTYLIKNSNSYCLKTIDAPLSNSGLELELTLPLAQGFAVEYLHDLGPEQLALFRGQRFLSCVSTWPESTATGSSPGPRFRSCVSTWPWSRAFGCPPWPKVPQYENSVDEDGTYTFVQSGSQFEH